MKSILFTAASSFVLALGLAGPAAAASGAGATGTGMGASAGAGMERSGAMTGTTMTGEQLPSFSDLAQDDKESLKKEDVEKYPDLQANWDKIDVDKNDEVSEAEFSAFEAGAEWQKQKQQGGAGLDKPAYERGPASGSIQSD
jgi:hypothetical protein